FGASTVDAEQTSLYATYTEVAAPPPPANIAPPTISGSAQQGQALTEVHGSWSNEPTSFKYQWLQCSSLGEGCLPISAATSQTYVPVLCVNGALPICNGASTVDAEQTSLYATYTEVAAPPPPANIAPPTISGSAQQGQALTEVHGSWSNEPTSFKDQCLKGTCRDEGYLPISAATSQTYVSVAGDGGHTIKVEETASNAGGSGSATSVATAVVAPSVATPPPPANIAPPTITGSAQQGQALTEVHGSWSNEPTSFKD